ncbi:MAG TPA: hypothetical protein VNO82_09710 [Solirubrobacteraceae bacterium]|nr:hypothetical protein [Solirubrobacteraceae bacterium]
MIDVVHLVWAPLGPQPFERFLRSYLDRPAGAEHRLVLVLKEFRDRSHSAAWDALAEQVPHVRVEMPEPLLDLGAYRRVALASDARALCFTNSSTELLADGWLSALDRALQDPHVGMVGATGSWESAYSAAPIWLKPLRRRHFAPFPNPHVRTNAFMLDRELLLSLDWPEVGTDKLAALRLESGRRSISSQVLARGLAIEAVGRDGRRHSPSDWPASGLFRSGDQQNLLAGDNRTAQYRDAELGRRRELARFAWGDEVG